MINTRMLLTPNYKKLHDQFIEIIATQIHYYDRVDAIALTDATCKEMEDMQNRSIERYKNDVRFNAKVKSMVAVLLQALTIEHDERMSQFGGDSGRIKLVEF